MTAAAVVAVLGMGGGALAAAEDEEGGWGVEKGAEEDNFWRTVEKGEGEHAPD